MKLIENMFPVAALNESRRRSQTAATVLLFAAFTLHAADKKPAKPELIRLEPRAIQSGRPVIFKLHGKNLARLKAAHTSDKKIKLELQPDNRLKITAPPTLQRGTHELWVTTDAGDSNHIKLHIGDLPQIHEKTITGQLPFVLKTTPASFWGTLSKAGETDRVTFTAKRGSVIVFDLQGKSLSSKASELVLTLTDRRGRVLARSREGGEPFLSYKIPAEDNYVAHIVDQQRQGSADHFYRLTIGALPYVTGFYPRTLPRGNQTRIELIGHNLPSRTLDVTPKKIGDFVLPLDANRYRFRNTFKAKVSNSTATVETEPNNQPTEARLLKLPAMVNGRISGAGDTDTFKFRAVKGKTYVLETDAARSGSPLDTHIEVLTAAGQPIRRVTLQAVRDSAINFRRITSTQNNGRVDNWEEMELNEFLYMEGEVVKLFRTPQGPDSGFEFYKAANSQRRTWFGTSGVAHAKDSPCYIVRPVARGAQLISTGLPVFHLNYENDDDGLRQLGTDSRLFFTAPANGEYLAHVSDSRSRGGQLFAYQLTIRKAKPDFKVTLDGANPSIVPGTGKGFAVKVQRLDGFEGVIHIDLPPVPKGYHITTPLVIQAGHDSASGTIYTAVDTTSDKPLKIEGTIKATATINGKIISKTINALGTLKATGKADMFLGLETASTLRERDARKGKRKFETKAAALAALKPLEVTIAPGETLPLWLAIQRTGRKGIQEISIANLPHGIIIDNIGLSGVEIAAESDRREIFLACAKWVPETDRLIFAVTGGNRGAVNASGQQTSLPVLLKVRRK
jgi:hypothetical protein